MLRVVRPRKELCQTLSVIVVGLEQHQVPLEVLERVAIAEDDLGKVVAGLRDRANLAEVVVLSTCMRTELYAVVERFHDGVTDLQEFLAGMAGVPAEELEERWTVLFDDAVPVHLFEVAAGLRSSVLGETEVLGQVRRARGRRSRAGQRAGALGAVPPRRPDRSSRPGHDRHRPRRDVAVARGGGAGCLEARGLTGRASRGRGGSGGDGRGHRAGPRRAR